MFQLNGKKISIDQDLVISEGDDAITIPAGSLQDPATREQYGITEEPDPFRADDRYYWNGNIETPKDLDELKAWRVGEVKQTANSLLAPSDWKVTRKFERGIEIDAATATYRADVIAAAEANEAAIMGKQKVSTLAAFVPTWPEAPK